MYYNHPKRYCSPSLGLGGLPPLSCNAPTILLAPQLAMADVLLISGCKDRQTSADVGNVSHAFGQVALARLLFF